MPNDVISEMLYGERRRHTPVFDVPVGAVVQIGDKAGVALEDVAKGEAGEFCMCGPFTFECAKTAAFHEGETVAYCPSRNAVVPLGTRDSFPVGVVSFDIHRGDGLVFVELNAQHKQ